MVNFIINPFLQLSLSLNVYFAMCFEKYKRKVFAGIEYSFFLYFPVWGTSKREQKVTQLFGREQDKQVYSMRLKAWLLIRKRKRCVADTLQKVKILYD